MNFLYAFPDWAIFIIVTAGVTLASMVVMLALSQLIQADGSKETFDIALRVMASIVAITTFMLAFSAIQARTRISQIEQEVGLEAKALGELDRLLTRFDETGTEPIRALLARYVDSIVNDEWPAMSRGAESPKARELVHELVKRVAELDPRSMRQQTIYSALVRAVDEIEDRRDGRIAGMEGSLPAQFWAMIVCLTLLCMASGALFKPTRLTVIMVGAQGAAIGLLIAFIFTLDQPYLGDATVSPAPYERVLAGLGGSAR